MGSFECGNKHSASIVSGEFLDQLRNSQLFRKDTGHRLNFYCPIINSFLYINLLTVAVQRMCAAYLN